MRKTALLVIAAGLVTAIAGGLTMVSHHAVAVSQSAPSQSRAASSAAASSKTDAPLEWNYAPEPIMAVGDGSAGN